MKEIKRFIKRFLNALDWFWYFFKKDNDFEFDYVYLLSVIQKKLQKMEPVIREGYALNSEKTANEIKDTIEVLELLIKDDFFKNFKELDGKYGEYIFSDLSFERPGVNKENYEQYRRDTAEAFRLDALEKKRVKDKFFRLLRKYENWWD